LPRVILIDPCLDPRWDAFVERHPYGWVCHLSGWKRALETAFPHMRGHYLALVDDSGQIQAGLPLFEVRSPITGNRLVSIPFASLSDPLVGEDEHMNLLLGRAIELLRALGGRYLEIRTHHWDGTPDLHKPEKRILYSSHFLDVRPEPEVLFQSFHRHGVRYMIKKSRRYPMDLLHAQDLQHVAIFHRLYTITRKKLGLPPQPLPFFQGLWRFLGPSGHVRFLLVRLGSEIIGGLMVLTLGKRMSAEAIGTEEKHRDKAPSFFLFWEAIKLARNLGCTRFDFGRTAKDNQGLMAFKSRWGTQVMDLPQFYWWNGRRPKKDLSLTPSMGHLRALCSRLPEPLFSALGAVCYKHMG